MSQRCPPTATVRGQIDPQGDDRAQHELPFEAVSLRTPSREPREVIGRLIRLKEVQHRVGLSRSAIYRFMAEGTFPKQVRASPSEPESSPFGARRSGAGRSVFRAECGPVAHQFAALVEVICTPVGGLDLVRHGVRQGGLGNLAREAGLLGRPVAER